MTNIEFVIKLQKKEKELIKIANYHNIFNDDCGDLIQDLYLKLLEFNNINKYVGNVGKYKNVEDDEPNMFIIFSIIRNMAISKYKSKFNYIDIEYVLQINNNPYAQNVKYEIIDIDELYSSKLEGVCISFVKDEINNIVDWYEKKIIDLYINENHSIRSLAKETKIGFWFLQPIIYNFKEECRKSIKNQK